MMGSIFCFVAIAFVDSYSLVPLVSVQRYQHCYLSYTVDALVLAKEAVWTTNGDAIPCFDSRQKSDERHSF